MGVRGLVLGTALFLLLGTAWAGTYPGNSPRQLFREADQAVQSGRDVDVANIMARLGDYPLAPYLRYHDYLNRLHSVTPERILAFRQAHPELPVVATLEHRWLAAAGAGERWEDFLQVDRGAAGGSRIDCYRLRAQRAKDGVDAQWLDRARALWTVGYSQPEACDPVFAALYERDALSKERRWQRIVALVKAGNTGTARALADRLSDAQRRWLDRWLGVIADPAARLSAPDFDIDAPQGRRIAEDGLRRLARSDQQRAMVLLNRFRQQGWLSTQTRQSLRRYVALRAAYDRDDRALEWLSSLPEAQRDSAVREWTARVALGAQNWPRLLKAIAALSHDEQETPQWQYWRAVALARTGRAAEAARLLAPLSRQRQYYGFLAADLLHRPYAMNPRPAPRDEDAIRALSRRPGMIRARELFRIGDYREARREWFTALAGADADTWKNAAHLAMDWHWYGQGVHGANRAGLHDALELRFPLAYRQTLVSYARQAGVDPSLAYALIRKESAFSPGAVSRTGALGLMQMMPDTARHIARTEGESVPQASDLLRPALNLRLGSAYLNRMLERFSGNLVAAVAAYNAGPTRAEGWQADNAGQDGAVWVENITYAETRDYVKSVLAFRAVFDWKLHGVVRRLTPVLEAVSRAPTLASRDPG